MVVEHFTADRSLYGECTLTGRIDAPAARHGIVPCWSVVASRLNILWEIEMVLSLGLKTLVAFACMIHIFSCCRDGTKCCPDTARTGAARRTYICRKS